MVITLESTQRITIEVRTNRRCLIRCITAIVSACENMIRFGILINFLVSKHFLNVSVAVCSYRRRDLT